MALWVTCAVSVARADGRDNPILNGDLTQGRGDSPDNWRTGAWKDGPEFVAYRWYRPAGAPGELEVSNLEPNDSYWAQTIHLGSGWYHFTASVRAEGVPEKGGGANISLLEDGITSAHLHGTTDWQTVGFYLKIGELGADISVACRLGGFADLNTGKAFCRDVAATAVEEPPADASFKYDLDLIRGVPVSFRPPRNNPGNWIRYAIFVAWTFLAGLLLASRKLAQTTIVEPIPEPEPIPRRRIALPIVAPPPSPAQVIPQARPTDRGSSDYRIALAVAACVVWVIAMAIRRLEGTPYAVNFGEAMLGIESLLPATGLAAIKLWTFWAFSAAVVAGLLLQLEPELDFGDAVLAGAAGVWVIAYLLGQALGPVGLLRPVTIWMLLAAGAVQLWRQPPRFRPGALSPGQTLALLAIVLLSVGMLPLELGSPAPPYMDVLNYPASVQRIMSFKRYLPFDNDPYGCWGPQAQTPAVDLFYAALGMGGGVNLGVLAESGVIVPMAAFMIFAVYRLGAATIGDTAGGFAGMLLFFTNTFRRLVGMKGTTIALGLVALALAFLIDRRSRRLLTAFAFLLLGTALASHAIEGGLGVAVAGVTLICREYANLKVLVLKLIGLGGAMLIAVPDFAIATRTILPFPILPVAVAAGVAVIIIAARMLPEGEAEVREGVAAASARMRNRLIIAGFAAALIYQNATDQGSVFAQIPHQFPMLSLLAALGLIALAALRAPGAETMEASPIVGAFLITILVETVADKIASIGGGAQFSAEVVDLHYKLDEYWAPFFMTLAAAVPFAAIADRGSRLVAAAALCVILIYPWNQRTSSYDYEEHSIAEEWGIDLGTAAHGYWSSTPDARWTVGPAERALIDVLKHEQGAGRITLRTHILHLAHDMIAWKDFNRFSVFTGIDDDPIVYEIPGSDVEWTAGSRIRMMSALPEALAERPPYILEQTAPPGAVAFPPAGYIMIFNRDSLRLFRREDLVSAR